MRRPAGSLACLVFLLLPLAAGCLGEGEDAAEGASAEGVADGAPPAEGAAPPVDAGGPAMPRDVGAQPHLHDYWQGRERITLFDGEVEATTDNTTFSTLAAAGFYREARVGGTDWLLPDGAIVFEGTGALELTVTLADPTVTSIGVDYRPAHTPEWVGWQAMEPGVAFAIPVSPETSDMPHSATSRWAFWFAPASPGAMLGPFHLKVDVVRMHDIGLFPGHPDLFGGADEKILMQDHVRAQKASYATKVGEVFTEGQFVEPEFRLGGIVPMETTVLRVDVTITGAEATGAQVSEARFFYRGADRSQLQPGGEPVEGSFEEGHLVWEIPVEMEMTDSPYAKESQWFLMVEPATSFTGQDPTCGGCVDSALEFDVVVTALRVIAEDAAS